MLQQGFAFTKQDGQLARFVGLRSSFDSDCAIQEIFRRAFELSTRASYDGRVPFAAYLNSIARNHALNTLRNREDPVEAEALDRAVEELNPAGQPPSPEQRAMHSELEEVVAGFRKLCSSEEQSIIDCRFLEGLSQADSAAKLGMTRRRVRKLEELLRKRLTRALKDFKP
jgi:RNA polymerase sigma factor (sigma-70 family)